MSASPHRYDIEWDEKALDHIRKHGIEKLEIESIFNHEIYRRKRRGYIDVYGRTDGGRILFIVLERTPRHKFRVAFARDTTDAEKSLYKRKVS